MAKKQTEKSVKALKYAKDPVFRAKVLRSNTQRYRKERARNVRNCTANLRNLSTFGSLRRCVTITPEGEVITSKPKVTFSTAQMSSVLGYHPVVMYGWHSKNKFPRPKVHVMDAHGKLNTVYSLEQAQELVKIIGMHQVNSQYLRDFDTEVIEALHSAVAAQK